MSAHRDLHPLAYGALASLFLLQGEAFAQPGGQARVTAGAGLTEAEAAEALQRAVTPTAVANRAGPATLDATASMPGGFEISADEDSSEITFKASIRTFQSEGVSQHLSVTAKAPLDKEKGEGVLGGLKGLGNAAAVEFKYTFSQISGASGVSRREGADLERICQAALRGYRIRMKAEPDPETLACGDLINISDGEVEVYAPEEYDTYMSLYFAPDASLTLFGVSGSAGTEKFEYRDPATLAEMSVHKTPWSLGGYWAYQRLSWPALITLRFDHKRVYEAAEEEIRCRDPADTTNCVQAAFGVPKAKDQDIASIELRRRLGKFGFALTASYDVGDDAVALDLPIYFIRDSDGGFNGGLRVNWDSKSHETKVGVFMNRSFSLFGDF